MKTVERKGTHGRNERRVLVGMVLDSVVLAKVVPLIENERGPFRSRWSNLISEWCVKYYHSYGRAPGRDIESLFLSWSVKSKDEELVSIVEKFLQHLSREHSETKHLNSDYVLDLAGEHLNWVRLSRLKDDMAAGLDTGSVVRALDSINNFSKVELGQGNAIDVFNDKEALRRAFSRDQNEVLIKYRGQSKQLMNFFGPAFGRDCFISFMGPEKSGKSFHLMDIACRAAEGRYNTALFVVGDMSERQVLRRIATRHARHPLKAKIVEYPTAIRWKDDKIVLKRKTLVFPKDLNVEKALEGFDRTVRLSLKTKRPLLKLSCHPADTIKASEIESILKGWEREGWVADVVVVDYADLLSPESAGSDTRDQINKTWMRLRALGQLYHALVVTATQTDASSYDSELLGRRHFSNDKRKYAHVTGMLGLNQTAKEHERGILRLNWVIPLREAPSNVRDCAYVAECRDLAAPIAVGAYTGFARREGNK